MAINLKAKESLIQIGKYAGTYRYVLSPVIYNKLSEAKVIQEAALRSGINRGSINAAWDAIGSVIQAWATEGHSVAIPGLGTMRFGVKASSASNVDKVSSDLINARKVIFTPSVAIKKELKAISVSIACYDRTGKLVKTVNSKGDDQGDFELELIASPEEGGTLEGAGFYNDGEMAIIKAIPAEGYRFVKWDDDEVEPERSIVVTDDISHVATFKRDGGTTGSGSGTQGSGTDSDNTGSGTQGSGTDSGNTGQGTLYTLSISSADASQGSVDTSVNKQYSAGSRVTIKATPASGYAFDKWSDGSSVNPRNITLNQDITLTASFKTATVTPPSEDDDDSPFDGGM